ncbi:hypothetical protein EGW08_022645, partial [Elysia chlorotica]
TISLRLPDSITKAHTCRHNVKVWHVLLHGPPQAEHDQEAAIKRGGECERYEHLPLNVPGDTAYGDGADCAHCAETDEDGTNVVQTH